jgi:hypothetical protein
VNGKPPAAPSGPHDCKDKHVRPRPIRLSTAERDVTPPLSIAPQSIMPQSAKNGIEGNLNDGNEKKKGKEHFVDLVLKCTAGEVLTTEMIRKFSRRARSYMLTYKALDIFVEEGREKWMGDEVDTSLDITYKQIENMQKIIKSHRAALDFDRGFIASTLKLTKNLDLKEAIEIGPQKKKRGRKRKHQ